MPHFRVSLLGRAGRASLTSKAGTAVPKAGQVGPRPGDLVPSLAALIPKAPINQNKVASEVPWVKAAETFFGMWKKLSPCMPKYAEFIALHQSQGLNVGEACSNALEGKASHAFMQDRQHVQKALSGKVGSDAVVAALGEFYLHVALQLRPQAVEEAGSDSNALLKIARDCAEDDFEPFVDAARELVSDYDPELHRALEQASPWYEVDDGLFWQANFDVAAPSAFLHFLTAVGHGSGQGNVGGKGYMSPQAVARQVALVQEGLKSSDPAFEPARRAAEIVYEKWFEASSMPVKADIKKILSLHGLIITEAVHDSNVLMPQPYPSLGMHA